MDLPKELVAASATPLVLSILLRGDSYGYAIIQRVGELSKGEVTWTDGMLYPILHRLEKNGFIKSYWKAAETGRRRKYYRLQDAGKKALSAQRHQWDVVGAVLSAAWGGKAHG